MWLNSVPTGEAPLYCQFMFRFKTVAALLVLFGALGLCLVPTVPMVLAERHHGRQAECKRVLRALMTRFTSDAGHPTLAALAAAVPEERSQPYTYVFSDELHVAAKTKAPSPAELSRQLRFVRENVAPGLRDDGTLTIACVANDDDDDALDVFSISTAERFSFGTIPVPAGELELQGDDFLDESHAVTFAPR
jgi:hypothetical protein